MWPTIITTKKTEINDLAHWSLGDLNEILDK